MAASQSHTTRAPPRHRTRRPRNSSGDIASAKGKKHLNSRATKPPEAEAAGM